jgi:hypothetical protein
MRSLKDVPDTDARGAARGLAPPQAAGDALGQYRLHVRHAARHDGVDRLVCEVRLREARATTENMARTLATQAYMELEIADVMLEDIAEHVRNEGNNDHTGERQHLQQLSKNIVEIAGVFIFDAQGDWLAASGAGQDGNNADRNYFIYHQTHAQLGSHISAPAQQIKRAVLPVSRRVEAADGTFAGVVLVTLGLTSFERIYATLAGTRARPSLPSMTAP